MSNKEVEIIRGFLKQQGFTDLELIDDLTDHLATEIEFCMDNEKLSFEGSFEKAKLKLLPNTPYQIERDLKFLTTPKHNIMIKKLAYLGGYLGIICLSVSICYSVLTFYAQKEYEVSLGTVHPEFSSLIDDIGNESAIEYFDEGKRLGYNKIMISYIRTSKTFFILTIFLALSTIVPYQFYYRYQRSQLELDSL